MPCRLVINRLLGFWWIPAAVSFSGLNAQSLPCGGGTQQIKSTVEAVVAAQVKVEQALAVRTSEDLHIRVSVGLDSLGEVVPGIPLWRATAWSLSHGHVYLLGCAVEGLVRLGGFPSPDLDAIAPVLLSRDLEVIAEGVRSLITVADPYGAHDLRFVRETTNADPVVASWERVRPATWPKDTLVARGEGYLVTVTVLSFGEREFHQPWFPIAYSFHISGTGRLTAWARRVGESFSAEGF